MTDSATQALTVAEECFVLNMTQEVKIKEWAFLSGEAN